MRLKLLFPVLLLSVFSLALSSCSKKDPHAGMWSWEVKNTPEGDFTGEMVILKEKGEYSGSFIGGGNATSMKNLVIEENRASFEASTSGYDVKVEGTFGDANNFEGTISAEGYKFPFKATKVSDKATMP